MIKLALLSLVLSVPAFSAPLPPLAKDRAAKPSSDSENFKITFKIKDGELEEGGSFVVASGSQANHIASGEKAFESGSGPVKGIDYKKHGVIVNCVPVAKPATTIVRAECQFELSGPLTTPVGDLKALSISSFQFQTAFEVERGHNLVLVEGPSRRIEVKIEAVAP